jgi:hypothetical protein
MSYLYNSAYSVFGESHLSAKSAHQSIAYYGGYSGVSAPSYVNFGNTPSYDNAYSVPSYGTSYGSYFSSYQPTSYVQPTYVQPATYVQPLNKSYVQTNSLRTSYFQPRYAAPVQLQSQIQPSLR